MTTERQFTSRREAGILRLQSVARWAMAVGGGALLQFGPVGCKQIRSQEHTAAETRQDTAGPGASRPSRALAYERERFIYAAKRRDPFLPPDDSATVGTMWDETKILGLIRHSRADLSVVLLGNVRSDESDDSGPAGRRRRPDTVQLRLGQSVGNTRLVRIHADRVVLEVDTPAGQIRRVLHVPRVGERNPA